MISCKFTVEVVLWLDHYICRLLFYIDLVTI